MLEVRVISIDAILLRKMKLLFLKHQEVEALDVMFLLLNIYILNGKITIIYGQLPMTIQTYADIQDVNLQCTDIQQQTL